MLALEDVQFPPPTVNDLATLSARAMLRPPDFEDRQRPQTIYLRDRPQWQELLPHLRQLGIEVVLAEDLPRFDKAVVQWMQKESARHGPGNLSTAEKIRADLRRPFPERKPTPVDAELALLRWTDEMWRAGYSWPRKGKEAKYDPDSCVVIPLAAEELQAILTQTDIARTKKLRPRLEAMGASGQDIDLSVHDWSRVLFSLLGGKREPHAEKHLKTIARRIATCLSEALRLEAPPP